MYYDVIISTDSPEDEDEENEQGEEGRHIVHGFEHDEQLVLERRQEADELEYAQQTERPQHRQAALAALAELHQAATVLSLPTCTDCSI